jgi:hypothetical protein
VNRTPSPDLSRRHIDRKTILEPVEAGLTRIRLGAVPVVVVTPLLTVRPSPMLGILSREEAIHVVILPSGNAIRAISGASCSTSTAPPVDDGPIRWPDFRITALSPRHPTVPPGALLNGVAGLNVSVR